MPTHHNCVLTRTFVPIYGQYLNVLITEDEYAHAWRGLLTDKYTPHPNANGSTYFDEAEGEGYVAVRSHAPASTVAHEAAHLTNYLLRYVGVKYDADNDEPFCYLLGWVVEQIELARAKPFTIHTVPDAL